MADPQTTGDTNAANRLQTTPSTVDGQIQPNEQSGADPTNPMSNISSPATAPPTAPQGQGPSQGQGPQGPPAPPKPQTPEQQHASFYQQAMGILSGGMNRPVMGPDGKPQVDANGTVRTHPGGVKQLGAGILAGAIASMMAGMATPTQMGPGGHRPDYGNAVAAGAAASQPYTAAGQQKTAQDAADSERARQYSTVDHNLKTHQMTQALAKADREDQMEHLSDYQSTNDAFEAEAAAGHIVDADGKAIDLYKYKDLNGKQAADLLANDQLHIAKDQVIPTKVIDVPNANGEGTHPETLWSVYNPDALVSLTDDLRKDYPQLKDVNVPVPARVLGTMAMNRAQGTLAGSGLDSQIEGYNASNPKAKVSNFDLKKAAGSAEGNLIPKLYPYLNKYRGDTLDAFFTDMKKDPAIAKDPTLQSATAQLMKAMGVTPAGLENMKLDAVEAAKARAKGEEAAPADPGLIKDFPKNMATRYPGVTEGQIKSIYEDLNSGGNPTVKMYRQAIEDIEKVSKENHAEKASDAGLDEKSQKMLFDYGVAGKTRLTLDNAPDEMLVNQRTGNPIPNKSLTAVKASQTEVNRAQFATSVLHLIGSLKTAQAAGKLPNNALLGGITNDLLSRAGLSSEDAQKAMTEISLMQSAATGAHVGGRFSVPVLEKMNKLLSLNMNDAQFAGTLDAIQDTMQGYKDNGGRFTVAEWKQLDPKERQRLQTGDGNVAATAAAASAKPDGAAGIQADASGNKYYVDAGGKILGRVPAGAK